MRLRCLLTGFPFGNMQLDGDKAAASITCVPGKSPAAPVGRLGHCVFPLHGQQSTVTMWLNLSLLFKKETFDNEVRLRVF